MLLYYLPFLSKDASIVFVFSFLLYVFGCLTNPLQQLTIPSVCCYLRPPFLKNYSAFYIKFHFCFEKHLLLKHFKNNFKIFWKYFLIVIVLYILRKSLCKFCLIFNIISFANAQGSVKIRLVCSKVFLLINYFDQREQQIFIFFMKVKGSLHTTIFSKYIELLPLKTFLGYFGNKRFSKQKYKKRAVIFLKMADMDNNKLPGLLTISWSDLLLSQEHIKERRKRRQWGVPLKER